jgi:hypothetical protein
VHEPVEDVDDDVVDAVLVDDSPTWDERISAADSLDELRDLYRDLISAGLLDVHGPEVLRRVDAMKAAQ